MLVPSLCSGPLNIGFDWLRDAAMIVATCCSEGNWSLPFAIYAFCVGMWCVQMQGNSTGTWLPLVSAICSFRYNISPYTIHSIITPPKRRYRAKPIVCRNITLTLNANPNPTLTHERFSLFGGDSFSPSVVSAVVEVWRSKGPYTLTSFLVPVAGASFWCQLPADE